MRLFILTLPIMTFSLLTLFGQAFLISYLMAGLLVITYVQHVKGPKVVFPLELKFYFIFLVSCFFFLVILDYQGIFVLKNVTQFITCSIYFIFYIVLLNVIVNLKWKKICFYIDLFIIISVIAALFAMFQTIASADSIFFNLLRNSNSAFFAGTALASLGGHGSWFGFNRVTGFAPEPSMWAAYLCAPLGILAAGMTKKVKIGELTSFLILFSSLILTYGRTGWLSFICAISYLPYFLMDKKYKKIYLISITSLIVVFLWSSARVDFNSQIDFSKLERLMGMTNAWNMFLANPIFGVGLGGYAINLDQYISLQNMGSSFGLKGMFTYNLYLKMLAETGIVGFMLWGGMLLSVFRKIFICIDKTKENIVLNTLCIGLALALISIIFSWINIEGFNFMYIWFIFALISAIYVKISRNSIIDE